MIFLLMKVWNGLCCNCRNKSEDLDESILDSWYDISQKEFNMLRSTTENIPEQDFRN